GDFLSASGTRFAIVARDGLFLSLPGQPPLGLQAIDATTYAARQANVLITFHESAGAPSDCTVHVDGVTIEARRG
ncbi:MAG TPA: hypothetical protein VHA53_03510, partial [Nitrolancea sp.]|nr:hypothetical protein [Nitrolancea sp.]